MTRPSPAELLFIINVDYCITKTLFMFQLRSRHSVAKVQCFLRRVAKSVLSTLLHCFFSCKVLFSVQWWIFQRTTWSIMFVITSYLTLSWVCTVSSYITQVLISICMLLSFKVLIATFPIHYPTLDRPIHTKIRRQNTLNHWGNYEIIFICFMNSLTQVFYSIADALY